MRTCYNFFCFRQEEASMEFREETQNKIREAEPTAQSTLIVNGTHTYSKIISTSILHRHGSRGPGESELSPWKTDEPVRSQWNPDELENLSSAGHKQCLNLGEWFQNYASNNGLGADASTVFWRCSKSGRAKESGLDFIQGFNANRKNKLSEKPIAYNENADNYFRPWKVISEFGETLKKRMATDELWANKAAENKEFLEKVFTKVGASGVLAKITKALWSTTYLHCIKECEIFWPEESGQRILLTNLLNTEEWKIVTDLACWVWEERFVRSGFTELMGCKLVTEIITQAINPAYEVNIFSGHDYTILAVLSLFGLIPHIDGPANFSCYILFELWDGPPPPHISGPPRKLANYDISTGSGSGSEATDDKRILRIVFNSFPFAHHDTNDKMTVQTVNEKNLGEFTIPELLTLTNSVHEHLNAFVTDTTQPSQSTVVDANSMVSGEDLHLLNDENH